MSALEVYGEFHDDIQVIFRSRLVTQVLLALGSEKRSLSTLRDITGSSSQALIPKIRQLEALQYVEQVRDGYTLTPIGRLVEREIERLVTMMGVIERHKDFWAAHDIESIPRRFLNELHDLYDAGVVRDIEEDVFAVDRACGTIIESASWIHGVSSIMSPVHAGAIREAALQGKPVELVVSQELAGKLVEEPYRTMLESLRGHAGFGLYVAASPVRLGMAVTDGFVSLGLYRRDKGTYDTATDLVSTDAAAIAWGERVFQHYRATADRLHLPSM